MSNVNILLTNEFHFWKDYDAITLEKYGFKYSDLIKREQEFLKNLLLTKYKNTIDNGRLVILVYIHADFGKRCAKDYKITTKFSKDWYKFMNTDDYSEVCTLIEARIFYNLT